MPANGLQGKAVIAAVSYHDTTIYPTDATPGSSPTRLVASDPEGRFHKVSHKAGNPSGTYEDDSNEYWQAIAQELEGVGALLLLGHGTGRANASHHFVTWVEKHDRALAEAIIADVRCNLDHMTNEQILAFGKYYFEGPTLHDLLDNSKKGQLES